MNAGGTRRGSTRRGARPTTMGTRPSAGSSPKRPDGTDWVCSATLVDSANRSVVWTAGHCVHSGRGARPTRTFAFVPAFRPHAAGGPAPFGLWPATHWGAAVSWTLEGRREPLPARLRRRRAGEGRPRPHAHRRPRATQHGHLVQPNGRDERRSWLRNRATGLGTVVTRDEREGVRHVTPLRAGAELRGAPGPRGAQQHPELRQVRRRGRAACPCWRR